MDYLAELLGHYGFKCTMESYTLGKTSDRTCYFQGNGVTGKFGDANCFTRRAQQRLIADNRDCFNKDSQVPLIKKLPLTLYAEKQLIKDLLFLGSKEGFKIASSDFGGSSGQFPYELD